MEPAWRRMGRGEEGRFARPPVWGKVRCGRRFISGERQRSTAAVYIRYDAPSTSVHHQRLSPTCTQARKQPSNRSCSRRNSRGSLAETGVGVSQRAKRLPGPDSSTVHFVRRVLRTCQKKNHERQGSKGRETGGGEVPAATRLAELVLDEPVLID